MDQKFMDFIDEMIDTLYDYCDSHTCGDYPCVDCIFNKIESCNFENMDSVELIPLYNRLKEEFL